MSTEQYKSENRSMRISFLHTPILHFVQKISKTSLQIRKYSILSIQIDKLHSILYYFKYLSANSGTIPLSLLPRGFVCYAIFSS